MRVELIPLVWKTKTLPLRQHRKAHMITPYANAHLRFLWGHTPEALLNSDPRWRLVAEEGIEPSIQGYESCVLPLDDSAIGSGSWNRTNLEKFMGLLSSPELYTAIEIILACNFL
jgi:hypothetical protein